MRFLLDTNFISEAVRQRVDPGVAEWTRAQDSRDCALSVLTLGEIRRGTAAMAPGKRKQELEHWLDFVLPPQFAGRVLSVDGDIAQAWGRLTSEAKKQGRHFPVIDGLLVSTALVRGLTLVTRNERDCAGWGVPILNPWSGD